MTDYSLSTTPTSGLTESSIKAGGSWIWFQAGTGCVQSVCEDIYIDAHIDQKKKINENINTKRKIFFSGDAKMRKGNSEGWSNNLNQKTAVPSAHTPTPGKKLYNMPES